MAPTRILLVDDEESLRITLAANLEMEGFEVIEACSGEQALELSQSQTFDLVLTDIRMPGISGVELFNRLHERNPLVPIVLMTAFAMEDLIQGAMKKGVFTLLSKPFDVALMVQTLIQAAKHPVVLVVDGHQEEAIATVDALNAAGVRAEVLPQGVSATLTLEAVPIDVCVVTLSSAANSPQIIEDLRKASPGLAVIAVAQQSIPELIQRVAKYRLFTTLEGPVDHQELIHAIAQARGPEGKRTPSR